MYKINACYGFLSLIFLGHASHNHLSPGTAGDSHSDSDTKDEHLSDGGLKHQISQVEPDVFIGLSLCCGFVFMLLIDHVSGGHSHTPPGTGMKITPLFTGNGLHQVSFI